MRSECMQAEQVRQQELAAALAAQQAAGEEATQLQQANALLAAELQGAQVRFKLVAAQRDPALHLTAYV